MAYGTWFIVLNGDERMLVASTDDLCIYQFTWGIVDANTFLIAEGNSALLIDAVDSEELLEAINRIDDLTIILTHSHFDHISGLNRIRQSKQNVKVYATSACSRNIGNKYRNMSAAGNVFLAFYMNREDRQDKDVLEEIDKVHLIEPFVCEPADIQIDEDLAFEWKGHSIHLSPCYGHSQDSLIIVMGDKYMFSGDTIMGIPTITRFIGGSTKRFYEEDIPKLESYVSRIHTVFPGHGEPGDLSKMIRKNVEQMRI